MTGNAYRLRTLFPPILAASILALAACQGDPLTPNSSHIQVLLTDAPHEELESAVVWISRIYLQGGEETDPETAESGTSANSGGRVDLYNDPEAPLEFDLLTLRDGLTADLTGLVEVDVGLYQGLRFVVDSARVTLVGGITFLDGTQVAALKVPSGSTSGIKVKLHDILDAAEGATTTVTVDFDVDDNFKIQWDSKTGLVRQISFTPVLKEKSRKTG
jgi:hypothetical protein